MNADDRALEDRLRAIRLPLPGPVRAAVVEDRRRPSTRMILPWSVALGAPAALAVLLAIVMILDGGIPRRPQTLPGIVAALSSGAQAAAGSPSGRQFVWLTGLVTVPPASPPASSGKVMDVRVVVLDWAGTVRYRFTLPRSTYPAGFNDIQSISADGTRALLSDGAAIDEKGAVVGHIDALATGGGPAGNPVRWLSDASGVCAAMPSTQDHTVALKVFRLDGSVRAVATVGSEPLGEPSGVTPDRASVVSCSTSGDQAVVARYHDYSDPALPVSHNSTQVSVGLWAVQLSTGNLLAHVPEARAALGRAFLFGSQDGRLAVEFLWNDKVAGSETDVVLRMPAGTAIPLDAPEPSPDTPAVSADGTRILRRVVSRDGSQTELKLVDAGNGHVIRRVVAKGIFGTTAVALPGASAFMVDVDGHLAIVDGSGGISLIHPSVATGRGGFDLPPMPGTQG